MTPATAEPLTQEAIEQFLAQLTDAQKRDVVSKLLPPILAPIKEKRAFHDEQGNLLGDYIPFPRVQPGQKVTMSDEARAALAKTEVHTRSEWAAIRAKRTNAKPTEPAT